MTSNPALPNCRWPQGKWLCLPWLVEIVPRGVHIECQQSSSAKTANCSKERWRYGLSQFHQSWPSSPRGGLSISGLGRPTMRRTELMVVWYQYLGSGSQVFLIMMLMERKKKKNGTHAYLTRNKILLWTLLIADIYHNVYTVVYCEVYHSFSTFWWALLWPHYLNQKFLLSPLSALLPFLATPHSYLIGPSLLGWSSLVCSSSQTEAPQKKKMVAYFLLMPEEFVAYDERLLNLLFYVTRWRMCHSLEFCLLVRLWVKQGV